MHESYQIWTISVIFEKSAQKYDETDENLVNLVL
jgi:hypothetical protein